MPHFGEVTVDNSGPAPDENVHPSVGSVVSKQLGHLTPHLPAYVMIPRMLPGAGSAYLGVAHKPFETQADPAQPGPFRLPNFTLAMRSFRRRTWVAARRSCTSIPRAMSAEAPRRSSSCLVSRSSKTPNLTVAGAEDITQRKANPWVVRASATSSQPSQPMADYAAKDLKLKRAICTADDFAFGHENVAGFQRVFEDAGGKVIQKIFTPLNAPDYGTYLSQFKNADCLYLGQAGRTVLPPGRGYGLAAGICLSVAILLLILRIARRRR